MQKVLSLALSFIAITISIGGLLFTIQQVRLVKSRLRFEIKQSLAATNRQLLLLAFDNPELFDILEDRAIENQSKSRHYIQMWLNHIFLMWEAHEQKIISEAEWYTDIKDISDFLSIKAVSTQWDEVKSFYPPKFVQFMIKIVGRV